MLRGDVNLDGVVNVEDAQLALNAYVAKMADLDTGLNDKQMRAADVNNNGELSIDDAQHILLYYVENDISGNPTTWEDILK